jgi:hypothetical protein
MQSALYEFVVRSFHFRQSEIQELIGSLDMAVEGYDPFNQCYLTKTIEKDLSEQIMKLVQNTISRKQEYEGIQRQEQL